MASYVYSAVADNTVIDFNPATDVFTVDLGLSPEDLTEDPIVGGDGVVLQQVDENFNPIKTVTLKFSNADNPLSFYQLSATNFVFANGAVFLAGDGLATTGDDSTTVTLTGSSGNDILGSVGGSQTINAGDGDDFLFTFGGQMGAAGGSGTDVFNGGNGIDWIGLGDVAGLVGYSVNLNTGLGAVDATIDSTFTLSGIENVDGSVGNDSIVGSAVANALYGWEGNDTLIAGDGNDTLAGGEGNDHLNGGAGVDVVEFVDEFISAGLNVNLATGIATHDGQTDTLANIEHVRGSFGNDTMQGGSAANRQDGTITDSERVEVFEGGAGGDVFIGAVDNITAADAAVWFTMVTYRDSTVGVNVNLATGQASDGFGNIDTLSNIDRVEGSSGNDTLLGGSNNLNLGSSFESFIGGLGDDLINGGGGLDRVEYTRAGGAVTVNLGTGVVTGAAGNDTLVGIEAVRGSEFGDSLIGGAANEIFEGRGGDDTISGGGNVGVGGEDQIRYTAATSGVTVAFAAAGSGTASDGQGGTDNFTGIEHVRGGDFGDSITGSVGNESFEGMKGNDTIDGGGGTDRIQYGASYLGAVTVNLSTGTATDSWGDTDTLLNIENVRGSLFADHLTGSASANLIEGGNGNDTLVGGGGADTLDGGLNMDTAVFSGNRATYTVVRVDSVTTTVDDASTLVTLRNVEKIQFADQVLPNGAQILFSALTPNQAINFNPEVDRLTIDGGLNAFNDMDIWRIDFGANVDRGVRVQQDEIKTVDLLFTSSPDPLNYYKMTTSNIVFGDGSVWMVGDNLLTTNDDTTTVTLNGTANNDVLISFGGSQQLNGGDGDDLLGLVGGQFGLSGGNGTDTLDGGNGVDFVAFGDTAGLVGVVVDLAAGSGSIDATVDNTFVLSNIEGIAGSTGNDLLTGNGLANEIDGGDAGNDTLHGGGGNDSLFGGIGNDTISGGDGADSLVGGEGHDTLEGGVGADTLEGGNGADVYIVADAEDQVIEDVSNGVIPVGGLTLDGSFADWVGVPNLVVDPAGDAFGGYSGLDVTSIAFAKNGATSTYLVHLTSAGAAMPTDMANYWIFLDPLGSGTGLALEVFHGGSVSPTDPRSLRVYTTTVVNGDRGDYTSWVRVANDGTSVQGTAGNIEFAFQMPVGIDLAQSYRVNFFTHHSTGPTWGPTDDDSAWPGVTVRLSGAPDVDEVRSSVSAYTLTANVENLTITAGGAANGTGNELANVLVGNAFANDLNGLGGNDSIVGAGGNDTLNGGGGNDTLAGGTGDDEYIVDVPGATIVELSGEGTDTVVTDALTSYTLADHVENLEFDRLDPGFNFAGTGNALANRIQSFNPSGSDTLSGLDGDDTLLGGGGADSLLGGNGNDVINGGTGADTLNGGVGADTLDYTGATVGVDAALWRGTATNDGSGAVDTFAAMENIRGGGFNDLLQGNGGANQLEGMAGNDSLWGGVGNDTLLGGDGNDFLNAGTGADSLNGGNGIDLADYSDAAAAISISLLAGTASNDGSGAVDTVTGVENVRGGGFNDTITGDAGNNVLEGLAGNDSLTGGDGNDTLVGGAGADTLNGGIGADTLDYTGATVGVDSALWRGTATNDGTGAIDTFIGIEHLRGGGFNDLLQGNSGANQLEGMFGNDSLWGGVGNDTLLGGDGNDFINAGAGADTLNGGNGTDLADYSDAAAAISISLLAGTASNDGSGAVDTVTGVENVRGGGFNDTITGDAGNNVLEGLAGNDSLTGGDGNDTLVGGAGADTLDGGNGADILEYAGATVGVDAALWRGTATNDGTGTIDTFIGIEHLRGGGFNDLLQGNGGANQLEGMFGNDSLWGGVGNDTLLGGDGNDFINAGAGADTLNGGSGLDTADYGNATVGVDAALWRGTATNDGSGAIDTFVGIENLRGGAFNDLLQGDGAANQLEGMIGNDNLWGGGGNDTVLGGDGHDFINGGAGADTVNGGNGLDTADYGNATVSVDAALWRGTATNDGTGSIDTFSAIENLRGGGFNDLLQGDAGANQLEGQGGNDGLWAGGGADTLAGGDGADILNGGAGTDSLTGGAGADRFDFDALTDSVVGLGRDVVTDFSSAQLDRIDLAGIDANTTLALDQAFSYVGSAAFSNVAGELRFAGGIVAGDTNGDGVADFEIQLVGVASLVASDFLL